MVWISRDIPARILCGAPLLPAYSLTLKFLSALTKLKSRLEHGAALRYNPQVEFKIQHVPAEHRQETFLHPYQGE
jgi:hypothetical protein